MTKEEAIRLLKTQRINGDDLHKAFDMAIKALEDSRWIPVTERLPEEDGDYLVCINGTVANIKGDIQIFKWLHGRWLLNWMKDCVTAWMPLPMPYEEEQNNETN